MKFPNKVTPYKDSILSKLPLVLNKIKNTDYPVEILYQELSNKITVYDFIDVLDCLFVLKQITLKMGIIHYVKRDSI